MNPVWKCEACADGPCYIQSSRKATKTVFGEEGDSQPRHCPYYLETEVECEPVAMEANPWSIRWIDRMQEWLAVDGYDRAPEELRDGIMIDLACRIDRYEAMRIINLLRNYEADSANGCIDRDVYLKQFAKLGKWELINAIFPEAFKAGLIYGEMIRQRIAEKADGGHG